MANWIAGAIKHPGALHKQLGVAQGKKIPAGKLAAAASKGGKLGERARLAETLKGFHRHGMEHPGGSSRVNEDKHQHKMRMDRFARGKKA